MQQKSNLLIYKIRSSNLQIPLKIYVSTIKLVVLLFAQIYKVIAVLLSIKK